MSQVDININAAAVTAIHRFSSRKGEGADFFISAQSSNCTVYLQVTLYDDEARRNCNYIHEGDMVRVTGVLKMKTYIKADGTAGYSLVIERPISFSKIVGCNSNLQSLQQTYNNSAVPASAVTATAVSADYDSLDEECSPY